MCSLSLILLLKPFNLKFILYRKQKTHLNTEVYFCLLVFKKNLNTLRKNTITYYLLVI